MHRPSFDGWPRSLQDALREAVRESVSFQRDLHVKEEADAAAAITEAGGEIVELTPDQRKDFTAAVSSIYGGARRSIGSCWLSSISHEASSSVN